MVFITNLENIEVSDNGNVCNYGVYDEIPVLLAEILNCSSREIALLVKA